MILPALRLPLQLSLPWLSHIYPSLSFPVLCAILINAGNTLTTCAHIITAVIGAGILSLPYAMASLGWIGGPICFILFAAITLYTAQLLADLYVIDQRRMRCYTDMVEYVFGRPGKIAIGFVQQFNLVLTALAYTITASQSMRLLAESACGPEKVEAGDCFNSCWKLSIIFGCLQILLSQFPNLEKLWFISTIMELSKEFKNPRRLRRLGMF